jgi:hypothetical protein
MAPAAREVSATEARALANIGIGLGSLGGKGKSASEQRMHTVQYFVVASLYAAFCVLFFSLRIAEVMTLVFANPIFHGTMMLVVCASLASFFYKPSKTPMNMIRKMILLGLV